MSEPDHILIAIGPQRSKLVDALYRRGEVIVPLEPSRTMIAASLATVVGPMPVHGAISRVPQREKHRRRIREAILAQAKKHLGAKK